MRSATAENGRVGLEIARKPHGDLILCDVMMPEMDGYAVVQALREDEAFDTPLHLPRRRADPPLKEAQ